MTTIIGATADHAEHAATIGKASMSKPVTAWSYSRWQTYDKCPYQFFLMVVEGRREEKSDAQLRGDRIHKAAANFVAGSTNEPGALLEARAIEKFKPWIIELRNMQPAPFVEQEWGFTEEFKKTGWFAKDTWWRVILDVCVLYVDNYADAIDYKTGKVYGENDEQMEQFAMSVFARYPQIHTVNTRLWYLDVGEESAKEYYRRDLTAMKEKWKSKVAPMFADKLYAPRPGPHCRFCTFRRANGGPCKHG